MRLGGQAGVAARGRGEKGGSGRNRPIAQSIWPGFNRTGPRPEPPASACGDPLPPAPLPPMRAVRAARPGSLPRAAACQNRSAAKASAAPARGWLAIFFRPACIFLLTARFEAGGLTCGPASGMPLGQPWPAAGGLPAPGRTTKPYCGPIGPPEAVQAVEKEGVMMELCLSSPAACPSRPSRLLRRPLRLLTPRSRPCSPRDPTRPRPTSRRSATG